MPERTSLYYGDNLTVLRDPTYIAAESVDLVYLDPPFKSDQDFNVLYEEKDGTLSESQMRSFQDTWHYDKKAQELYEETVNFGPEKVATTLEALMSCLGRSDMMAYLVNMAPRLSELRTKLKSTGSLYLHCDPSASHYLKMVLDSVFGPAQFRNEIVWRRTGAHSNPRRFGGIHDTLLFYSKTDEYYFKPLPQPYMKGHVEKRYRKDETGKLKFISGGNILTGAGKSNGESGRSWRGFNPTAKNRHWAVPGFLSEQMPEEFKELGVLEKMDVLYEAGLIEITEGNAWPNPVRYLDDVEATVQDIWAYQPYTEGTVFDANKGIDADVKWLGPTDPERVGYKTQKPIGLLERVVKTSCPENGLVLDPFCGCGTAIVAAQQNKRGWIGIDVTAIAIAVVKDRLRRECKIEPPKAIGEPASLADAAKLAQDDPYQFQWWALGCLGGKKFDGKKGRDRGIDGRIRFYDEPGEKAKQIIVSVKAGNPTVAHVRDLKAVVAREKAQIGVLVVLNKITKDMRDEALEAEVYESPWGKHRKIQIMTALDLVNGKKIDSPPIFAEDYTKKKKAERAQMERSRRQRIL